MGVVDVQARAVGEDDVCRARVLLGLDELGRDAVTQVEPARVAQRRLLLEVPAGPPVGPGAAADGVGVDDLSRQQHGVGARVRRCAHAVLDLGPHDPDDGHQRTEPSAIRRRRDARSG